MTDTEAIERLDLVHRLIDGISTSQAISEVGTSDIEDAKRVLREWLADDVDAIEREAREQTLDEVLAAFGPEAVEDHLHARWTYVGIEETITYLREWQALGEDQ